MYVSINVRLVDFFFLNLDFDASIPSLPPMSIPREGLKIDSFRIAAWPSCHLHQRLLLCYFLSLLCPTECVASQMHLSVSQSTHLLSSIVSLPPLPMKENIAEAVLRKVYLAGRSLFFGVQPVIPALPCCFFL